MVAVCLPGFFGSHCFTTKNHEGFGSGFSEKQNTKQVGFPRRAYDHWITGHTIRREDRALVENDFSTLD